MNIVVLSSNFPNKREIIKGIYIYHIAKALSKLSNVIVIAPLPYFPKWIKSKNYSNYTQINGKEKINDLDVYHPRVIVIPKIGRSLYGILYFFTLFPIMKKIVKKFNPDIIICYWVYPDGFATTLISKILNIPIINGGRGCDVNNANEFKLKEMMVSWTLKKSNRIFSVSQAMKRKMIELGCKNENIKVIPNGLDPIFIEKKEDDRVRGIKEIKKKQIILFCGRFSHEKGLVYLIEAAKILAEKKISYEMHLVGKGPEISRLMDLVKKLGLKEIVLIKNEVPQNMVPNIMRSADIFCLPSIREGWPNVIMEAMASGLPVVATDVGGVPEIITSKEYGIVVPKENIEKLAEALEKALKIKWSPTKIKDAVRNRTWENVACEILEEVNTVLGAK